MTPGQKIRHRRERLDCRYREMGRVGDACVYCGVESSSWDHVPPLSVVEKLIDVDIDRSDLRKVPACHECNSILGARHINTIAERRKYILQKLSRKYAKHLRMPQWDDEELSEVSERLAEDIQRNSHFAWYIKQRTSWARSGGRR